MESKPHAASRARNRRHGVHQVREQHARTHRVRQDVDAFQAGIVRILPITPARELVEGPAEPDGTGVGRVLIVPVALQQAPVVVARPERKPSRPRWDRGD